MQCLSTTSSGRQCRNVCYLDGRCYHHRLSKCICKTKRGTTCKITVQLDRMCHSHFKQDDRIRMNIMEDSLSIYSWSFFLSAIFG